MKIEIWTETKKIMFGPVCHLCSGRKNIRFMGRDYCPSCESHILEAEVVRSL